MKSKNKKERGKMIFVVLLLLVFSIVLSQNVIAENVSITETSPSGYTNINPVLITVETDTGSICKYDFNETNYTLMNYTMEGTGTLHELEHELSDGSYQIYVRCRTSDLNLSEVKIMSFILDTIQPTITIEGPSGILNDEDVTFDIKTNEDTTCKYDASDEDFEDMSFSFTHSGGTIHRHSLKLTEGEFNYHIKCEDLAGNVNYGVIVFEVNRPPSATISIDGNSILKDGRYEVSVRTSENVIAPPQLQYNYNDDGNKKTVSLTGSGSGFNGYIIIPDNQRDRIGTFYFAATDESGLSGNDITSGKLFLIDTKNPGAVTAFSVESLEDEIELRWHFDGEDVKHFRIYRDTTSGVTKSDYYTTTKGNTYTDIDVDLGQTYYYRISVVDEAENEGELSKQASGTSVRKENIPIQKQETQLDSDLRVEVTESIKTVEQHKLDVDSSVSYFETLSNAEEIKLADTLKLLDESKLAQKNFEQFLTQLEDLYSKDLDQTELKKRLDKIVQIAERTKTTVPEEIKIISRSDFNQNLDLGDYNQAIDEQTISLNLNEEDKSSYLKKTQELQDFITVQGSVVTSEVQYFGGNSKKITYLQKDVVARNGLSDVDIVEIIPKEAARRVSEINFIEKPIVLNEDPVVKWKVPSLSNYKIEYYLEKETDLNAVKKTKTIVMLPFQEKPEETEELPTGNVVKEDAGEDGGFSFEFDNKFLIGFGVFMIAGLLVYYFFFMNMEEKYETGMEKNYFERQKQNKNSPKIVQKSMQSERVTNFMKILTHANVLADTMNIREASMHYEKMHENYNKLNSNEQQTIHSDLIKLYNKIELVSLIEKGKEEMSNGNNAELKLVLTELRKMHPSLTRNSHLYDYVKSNHDHFKDFLLREEKLVAS